MWRDFLGIETEGVLSKERNLGSKNSTAKEILKEKHLMYHLPMKIESGQKGKKLTKLVAIRRIDKSRNRILHDR